VNGAGLFVVAVVLSRMDTIVAQHGYLGQWHLETNCVNGRWEWRVFDVNTHIQISGAVATSLETAKSAAEVSAGGKPEWNNIDNDIEEKPAR
jgi:hypothetical protein